MEHYRIVETLYTRGYCVTYLATEIGDYTNQRLILKKIECKDENHANQAYRELLKQKLLQDSMGDELSPKEFFIMWDISKCSQKSVKKASIFICVIRLYMDTLLTFEVQSYNLLHKAMKEKTIIELMLGIVRALEPFHKRNIPHRSLRLSNIVKMAPGKPFLLADFGIPSHLSDRRKFSKLNNIDTIWLAPEIRFPEQPPQSPPSSTSPTLEELATLQYLTTMVSLDSAAAIEVKSTSLGSNREDKEGEVEYENDFLYEENEEAEEVEEEEDENGEEGGEEEEEETKSSMTTSMRSMTSSTTRAWTGEAEEEEEEEEEEGEEEEREPSPPAPPTPPPPPTPDLILQCQRANEPVTPEPPLVKHVETNVCWFKMDMWCLGSICLSFMLSSFTDPVRNMKSFLLTTSKTESVLHLFSDKLGKIYSKDLLVLTENLMHWDPIERPTLLELKEVLTNMYQSFQPIPPDWPEDIPDWTVPEIEVGIVQDMVKFSGYRRYLINRLNALKDHYWLTPSSISIHCFDVKLFLPTSDQTLLWELVRDHENDLEVISSALCNIDYLVSTYAEHADNLTEVPIMEIIINLLKSPVLQSETGWRVILYGYLVEVAKSENGAEDFNRIQGLSQLCPVLSEDFENEEYNNTIAKMLSHLCADSSNCDLILKNGLLETACQMFKSDLEDIQMAVNVLAIFIAMVPIPLARCLFHKYKILSTTLKFIQHYITVPSIIIHSCLLISQMLQHMSLYDDGMMELMRFSVTRVMCNVLFNEDNIAQVVTECCTTLALLCEMSEENAYTFLWEKVHKGLDNTELVEEICSLNLLMRLWKRHCKDNDAALEAILKLIYSLSRYDEGSKELISYEFKPFLLSVIEDPTMSKKLAPYAKECLKCMSKIEDIMI